MSWSLSQWKCLRAEPWQTCLAVSLPLPFFLSSTFTWGTFTTRHLLAAAYEGMKIKKKKERKQLPTTDTGCVTTSTKPFISPSFSSSSLQPQLRCQSDGSLLVNVHSLHCYYSALCNPGIFFFLWAAHRQSSESKLTFFLPLSKLLAGSMCRKPVWVWRRQAARRFPKEGMSRR